MTIHYAEAARRHHQDAVLLFETERIPNADHHYGLAAECALVAIIRSLDGTGHLFDANGEAVGPKTDKNGEEHGGAHVKQHVDKLWKSFWTLADKHDGKTTMKGVIRKGNPFEDWAVKQRYFADGHWCDTSIVEKHGKAANGLLVALQVALDKQAKNAARRAPRQVAVTPEPEGIDGEAPAGEEQ